ncbi:MAG: hypothetical protein N2578_10135, partial [Bdellovibrionaceae bacterium]|nr:hypothetical protein [Pseudobdellovibrionaceae bacterium]
MRSGSFCARLLVLLCSILGSSFSRAEEFPLYLSYEQRILTAYALAAHGVPSAEQESIYQRLAKLIAEYQSRPTTTIKVRNFDEFLRHYRGEWPETESLREDLRYLERDFKRGPVRYETDSPRIQKRIDSYLERAQSKATQALQVGFSNINPTLLLAPASLDPIKTIVDQQITQFIERQFAEMERIGQKMGDAKFFAGLDPAGRRLLTIVFSEYYKRLSLDSKKQILAAILRDDPMGSENRRFEIMVQNSGPQMQKLLQILAGQSRLDENLRKIFKTLEDNLRPASRIQVRELIEAEKSNYEFVSLEEKP